MNKRELVAAIAESGSISKASAVRALNVVLEKMVGAMENGERVNLSGFGCFRVKERAVQKGRNPQTGKPIVIPAHNTVKFKAGNNLRRKV